MQNYEDLSLEQLETEAGNYIWRHRENGGSSEFDTSINDISRAIIQAYHLKRRQCYMGGINLYDTDYNNPNYQFTLYTPGQTIYNFQYDIILPCNDPELLQLIKEQNKPHEPFSCNGMWNRIQTITLRIQQLEGIQLHWA